MGFQRFIKALEARYQNWQSKNYEKTKYGRALLKLKDQHRGERCFVIGNGPSLSPEDLQKLHENGIACFATNRIYKMFDRTDWRPTYYVSEDVNVLRGVQKEASQVPAEIKFIPVNSISTLLPMEYIPSVFSSYESPVIMLCSSALTVP